MQGGICPLISALAVLYLREELQNADFRIIRGFQSIKGRDSLIGIMKDIESGAMILEDVVKIEAIEAINNHIIMLFEWNEKKYAVDLSGEIVFFELSSDTREVIAVFAEHGWVFDVNDIHFSPQPLILGGELAVLKNSIDVQNSASSSLKISPLREGERRIVFKSGLWNENDIKGLDLEFVLLFGITGDYAKFIKKAEIKLSSFFAGSFFDDLIMFEMSDTLNDLFLNALEADESKKVYYKITFFTSKDKLSEREGILSVTMRQPLCSDSDWQRLEQNRAGVKREGLGYLARSENIQRRVANRQAQANGGHGLWYLAQFIQERPSILMYTRPKKQRAGLKTSMLVSLKLPVGYSSSPATKNKVSAFVVLMHFYASSSVVFKTLKHRKLLDIIPPKEQQAIFVAFSKMVFLENKLTDSDEGVRKAAVNALGLIWHELWKQGKLPISTLENKLTDSDEDVRKAAVNTLGLIWHELWKQGKLPISTLENKLTDHYWSVRKAVVNTLDLIW
ncbi:MAG: HEAT repeat domain-containing protein, partial [Candidatus Omnitrophica bacterium]|nr:HEAT repeat domain-containing protein [Candidatus Omnitrophota bacterium]